MRIQRAAHAQSLDSPVDFWGQQSQEIIWSRSPTTIFKKTDEGIGYEWFAGGELNTCYNCVDRWVDEGRGNDIALYFDSPLTQTKSHFTFAQLKEQVSMLAALLSSYGVVKGTTVLIYMPMVPQAIFSMLACARLGAIHSVVFGGFAPKELAKRIEDCKPLLIMTASCGLEPGKVIPYRPMIEAAINMCSYKPRIKLILQRPQHPCQIDHDQGERDWTRELNTIQQQGKRANCVTVRSNDPLYLLYTSGSTGTPKGVVRDNGGHAVALKFSMKHVYGIEKGDVWFAASDIGWVVGHSYIVYGPLLVGASTVLYEGKPVGTPDAGAFWRLVQAYNIKMLFTAPTAIRAIKKEDPKGLCAEKYRLNSLKGMFVAGERADTDTLLFFGRMLNVPIRDNMWQTELGWPAIATCCPTYGPATPVRLGSAGLAVAGYHVHVFPFDTSGDTRLGNLAIKLPLPPGCCSTLWNNHTGFFQSYLKKFPGYFDLTDSGFIDQDGYIFVMSRTDDIINVAGHRLSTGGMEEILSKHKSVAEVAVVTVKDALKGEKPVGFVVLKADVEESQESISKELIMAIRESIGAFACFHTVYFVQKLPKTRSGKILRRTLRSILNREKYEIPATIDDESTLVDIERLLFSTSKL